MILKNIHDNYLDEKVFLYPIGLASEMQTAEIRTCSVHGVARYNAPCMRLDEIICEEVSVIKIDVEGMELDVLKGAEKLLTKYSPSLFVEVSAEKEQSEITSYLSSLGYVPTGNVFNATPTWEFVKKE